MERVSKLVTSFITVILIFGVVVSAAILEGVHTILFGGSLIGLPFHPGLVLGFFMASGRPAVGANDRLALLTLVAAVFLLAAFPASSWTSERFAASRPFPQP